MERKGNTFILDASEFFLSEDCRVSYHGPMVVHVSQNTTGHSLLNVCPGRNGISVQIKDGQLVHFKKVPSVDGFTHLVSRTPVSHINYSQPWQSTILANQPSAGGFEAVAGTIAHPPNEG